MAETGRHHRPRRPPGTPPPSHTGRRRGSEVRKDMGSLDETLSQQGGVKRDITCGDYHLPPPPPKGLPPIPLPDTDVEAVTLAAEEPPETVQSAETP